MFAMFRRQHSSSRETNPSQTAAILAKRAEIQQTARDIEDLTQRLRRHHSELQQLLGEPEMTTVVKPRIRRELDTYQVGPGRP